MIKSRAYKITVDNKSMRVIDPTALSVDKFAKEIVDKFGRDRVQKITLVGELRG